MVQNLLIHLLDNKGEVWKCGEHEAPVKKGDWFLKNPGTFPYLPNILLIHQQEQPLLPNAHLIVCIKKGHLQGEKLRGELCESEGSLGSWEPQPAALTFRIGAFPSFFPPACTGGKSLAQSLCPFKILLLNEIALAAEEKVLPII